MADVGASLKEEVKKDLYLFFEAESFCFVRTSRTLPEVLAHCFRKGLAWDEGLAQRHHTASAKLGSRSRKLNQASLWASRD